MTSKRIVDVLESCDNPYLNCLRNSAIRGLSDGDNVIYTYFDRETMQEAREFLESVRFNVETSVIKPRSKIINWIFRDPNYYRLKITFS